MNLPGRSGNDRRTRDDPAYNGPERRARSRAERRQDFDYRRDHPNGALGIPPAVIVKSIRDTRQTIHALRGLRC